MTSRLRRYAPLFFLAAAAACGGIVDPTKGGENVATISGALTGASVPTAAHVALVWREAATNKLVIGADAPIVDGRFTLTLSVPGESYFASEGFGGGSGSGSSGSPPSIEDPTSPGNPDAPPPVPTNPGTASSSGGAFGVKTLSNASGQITGALEAAVGGFVVYVDKNGNGQLDLEGTTASSPDDVIGGNSELFLAYLRGGGQLDYEKLRDKSGVLPARGWNLVWAEGRWLPLDLVELKLGRLPQLPRPVCAERGASATPPNDPGASTSSSSGGGYATGGSNPPPPNAPSSPSAMDPDVICSPDGRSYTVKSHCPPPPPPGLCSGDHTSSCYEGGSSSGGAGRIGIDQPVPPGWPCPVEDALDGGGYDASMPDAGQDAARPDAAKPDAGS